MGPSLLGTVKLRDGLLTALACRGTFLLQCGSRLVTGVCTTEADLQLLLGCSDQAWAEVKQEARQEGRLAPGSETR